MCVSVWCGGGCVYVCVECVCDVLLALDDSSESLEFWAGVVVHVDASCVVHLEVSHCLQVP